MTMNKENIKEGIEGKVSQIEEQLKKHMDTLKNNLVPAMKELTTIENPKSKKDIKINNKNGYVSLLTDGRIIIHSPSIDDATDVYERIESILSKQTFLNKLKNLFK